jgi:hypothetical protein
MEGMVRTFSFKGEYAPPLIMRMQFNLMRNPFFNWLMVVKGNMFLNKMLPDMIMRKLTFVEKAAYHEPYLLEKDRKPVARWPMEIPIDGFPAGNHATVSAVTTIYAHWLTETQVRAPPSRRGGPRLSPASQLLSNGRALSSLIYPFSLDAEALPQVHARADQRRGGRRVRGQLQQRHGSRGGQGVAFRAGGPPRRDWRGDRRLDSGQEAGFGTRSCKAHGMRLVRSAYH